jgi:hypothetical protein
MSAPRRNLSHPALACLACLVGLVLVCLPLGADPWLRRPVSLYPWLFGVWLLLVAFLRVLGRALAQTDGADPQDGPPASSDRTGQDV